MKLLKLRPDKITYDSLVRACEKGEQWQLANEYIEKARAIDAAADERGS